MQFMMNRVVAQCRQKCEVMQEKYTEKLEQVHAAYQKMAKRCQVMEQEIESLSKDKQELQDKFAEKSRFCLSLKSICENLLNDACMLKSFGATSFFFSFFFWYQTEEKAG